MPNSTETQWDLDPTEELSLEMETELWEDEMWGRDSNLPRRGTWLKSQVEAVWPEALDCVQPDHGDCVGSPSSSEEWRACLCQLACEQANWKPLEGFPEDLKLDDALDAAARELRDGAAHVTV